MKQFLPCLVFVAIFLSCNKDSASQQPATKVLELPAAAGTVLNASNQTAFGLFGSLLSSSENKNILISPLSIYMALGMVYNGAANATRDSMAAFLNLEGNDVENLNATSKALIEQLPAEDSYVTLSIANSIWFRKNNLLPVQSFLDIAGTQYDATVSALDFSSPSALTTINQWVSDKTHGKIPAILDKIDDSDLMFLINAVYFNGRWTYQFKTADTYTDLFHITGSSTTSAAFMKQELNIRNASNAGFDIIELPYGSGKGFCMYILLPKQTDIPVNQFASTLHTSELNDAIARMDSSKKTIIIPKWEYSYSLETLKEQLSALGMGIAFSDSADFSNMYPAKVKITKAVHKTYIKVTEEGTEAAGATAIGIGVSSSNPAGTTFKADHPFVYIIAEKQTGAILFTGILNDPSKN